MVTMTSKVNWLLWRSRSSKKTVHVKVMKISKYVEKWTKNILFYQISNMLIMSWKIDYLLWTIFSENCKTRPIWRRAYSIEQNVKQLFLTNLRKFEVILTKIDWIITGTATGLFKRRSEKRAKNVAFSIHSMTLFHF